MTSAEMCFVASGLQAHRSAVLASCDGVVQAVTFAYLISDEFLVQSFPRTNTADAVFLRVPLFRGHALYKACVELTRVVSRLVLVGTQKAFILPRPNFSSLSMLFSISISPCLIRLCLLRTVVERIVESSLADAHCIQASSPIRDLALE